MKRSHVLRLRIVGVALVLAACSFGALIGYAGDATSISASFVPSPVDVDATTTCTVTVHNNAATPNNGTPQGSVSVTKTAGTGTITGTCGALNGSGQCTFNYTPSAGGTHSFNLVYTPSSGDWNATSGSTSVTANRLATHTTLELDMTSAFINQTVKCTAHVVAAGTGIPVAGDVDFDNNGAEGSFSSGTCTLNPAGRCVVYYTPGPGEAGTTTLTAEYQQSAKYATSDSDQALTVKLRTTELTIDWHNEDGNREGLYVDETATVTVTVRDVADGPALAPQGQVTVSTDTGDNGGSVVRTPASPLALSGGPPAATSEYVHIRETINGDLDTVFHAVDTDTCTYVPETTDQVHKAPDESTTVQFGIQKRATECTVTCPSSDPEHPVSGATHTCEALIDEACGSCANRGTYNPPFTPEGLLRDASDPGTPVLPSTIKGTTGHTVTREFTVTMDANQTSYVASVKYEGSNKHMPSMGSDMIHRSVSDFGDPDSYQQVHDLIVALGYTCQALEIAETVIEIAAHAVELLPDPVVTALFGGSTIPVSDIAATIIDAVRIAIQAGKAITCTDQDMDGIPFAIEIALQILSANSTLDDTNPDVDGDGIDDGTEIDMANGRYDPFWNRNNPAATWDWATQSFLGGDKKETFHFGETPCPCPHDEDTDGDTLGDGEENLALYPTDRCNPDTDFDYLRDDEEIKGITTLVPLQVWDEGGTLINYGILEFFTSPVIQDTDGDGVYDGVEVGADGSWDGSSGVGIPGRPEMQDADPSTITDPLVGDTDQDGLDDGTEDVNGNGLQEGTPA